jgi:hypothetical protein
MGLDITQCIGVRDALQAEGLHQPAIEEGRIMGDDCLLEARI